MKECKYCGTTYADNQEACPNCGGNVVVTAAERQEQQEQAAYEKTAYVDNSKRLRKLILGGIGVLAVVIIVVVISVVSSLNKPYTYTDSDGRNGEISRADIKDAIELGDTYLAQGEYLKAIEQFQKVPNEHGDYSETQQKLTLAADSYSAEILSEADALLSAQKFTEAIAVLDNAVEVVGSSNTFALKKDESLGQYRDDFLTRANAYLEDEQYSKAKSILKIGQDVFGEDDAELSAKMREIDRLYKADFIRNTNAYIENEQYDEALSTLKTAQSIFGLYDTDINEKLTEVNKTVALTKIAEYESAGDYAAAIEYIIKYESENEYVDQEVVGKTSSLKEKYTSDVFAMAAAAYKNGDYLDAIAVLQGALDVLPNSADFLQEISRYEEYAPVYLTNLEYFTGTNLDIRTAVMDNLGLEWDACIYPHVCWSTNSIGGNTYKLNGQYNRIEGVFFHHYDDRNSSNSNKFAIYGDGKLLYTAKMTAELEPIEFSVSLTGVSELYFEYYVWGDWTQQYLTSAIANCALYK